MKINEIINEYNRELRSFRKDLNKDYSDSPRSYVDQHSDLNDKEKSEKIDPRNANIPYVSSFMGWPKNKGSFLGNIKKNSKNNNNSASNQKIEKPVDDQDFYTTVKNLLTKNQKFGEMFVDVFGDQSKQKGYIPERAIYKQDANLAIISKNELTITLSLKKTADKPTIYIGKFSTTEATLEAEAQLKKKLPTLSIRCLDNTPKHKVIRIDFSETILIPNKEFINIISDFMNIFWTITNAVESLEIQDDDIDSSASYGGKSRGSGSDIRRPKTPLRYYIGAAEMIQTGVKRSLGNLIARGTAELYDIADNMITIGATAEAFELLNAGEKKPYREHAVPCEMIVKKAVKMFQDDRATVIDVAKMIRRNLMIVLMSDIRPDKNIKSERERLDAKYKTTMPSGWDFETGHPLARFRAVDPPIPVFSIQDYKRLSEDD